MKKKNKFKIVKWICFVLGVVCLVLSFVLPKKFDSKDITGKYIYENKNEKTIITIEKTDNGYKGQAKIIDTEYLGNYRSCEFTFDEVSFRSDKRYKTSFFDKDAYIIFSHNRIYIVYENDVIIYDEDVQPGLGDEQTYEDYSVAMNDIDISNVYIVTADKTEYVDYSGVAKNLKIVLTLVAILLLEVFLILYIKNKKKSLVIVFSIACIVLILAGCFINISKYGMEGRYRFTVRKNSIKLYEYELELVDAGYGERALIINPVYNIKSYLNGNYNNLHPVLCELEKKGNSYIISSDTGGGFEIQSDYEIAKIKNSGMDPRITFLNDRNKVVEKYTLFSKDTDKSRNVVQIVFVVVMIIVAAGNCVLIKTEKVKKDIKEPLIPAKNFVFGEIIYKNPELEDFVNHVIKSIEHFPVNFKTEQKKIFTDVSDCIGAERVTNMNIFPQLPQKLFSDARIVRLTINERIYYLVSKEDYYSIIMTYFDMPMLMIGLKEA